MTDLPRPQAFFADIHAMPCTNRCRHCWANGCTVHGAVDADTVFSVLTMLADLRTRIPQTSFLLYDEPTNHPRFLEILERASALGLIWDGYFLATNGSILASADDAVWERMKAAGVATLQLTAYGLEKTHDSFAGRRGAFDDVLTTIRRAREHGVGWYAGIVLHEGNVGELAEAQQHLASLDPTGSAMVGWYPFLWQGRGRDAGRVRAREYERLPEEVRERAKLFLTEAEAVRRILGDSDLSEKPVGADLCAALTFQVDRDLVVSCGGACDGGGIAAAAPELAEELRLGALGDDGFLPLLDGYLENPPRPLRLLQETTWGELAERHGDPENDEIYFLSDLPQHKWAARYLREPADRHVKDR